MTQPFHIFLPIAVKYNWGNIAYDKKLDPYGKNLDKDFTQVVWAVITVNESASQNEYNLTINTSGNGSVYCNNSTIRGQEESFTVTEGSDAVLTFQPDNGYRIKTVVVNGSDVTLNVSGNQYTISGINKDTMVKVEFEVDGYTEEELSEMLQKLYSIVYDNVGILIDLAQTIKSNLIKDRVFVPEHKYVFDWFDNLEKKLLEELGVSYDHLYNEMKNLDLTKDQAEAFAKDYINRWNIQGNMDPDNPNSPLYTFPHYLQTGTYTCNDGGRIRVEF